MELSKSTASRLYDPVRRLWVKRTQEEEVRNALVIKMVEELGYPLSGLSVEKELVKLPHLQLVPRKLIPNRRADIISFAKDIHPHFPLYPLLMIECKKGEVTVAHLRQVVGYNQSVKAHFLCVAGAYQMVTGSYNREKELFEFVPGLPSFIQLLQALKSFSIQASPK
ncbi:MAG: type I restriction enzyme HsdR N-terminal domain-containing protein [Chlamydiia bacterium]|nr:type I restriction enzyme HsdR N-terminal domain-containing protein [Chlamydiia bacterium]